MFAAIAATCENIKGIGVLAVSLPLVVACSTTKPIDDDFKVELSGLYTCARYYHLIGEPDTGNIAIEKASSRGKSERADPVDMMVVYLAAKKDQDIEIRDHIETMPDAIGSKKTLKSLLDEDTPDEMAQMDQINAADQLYADLCAPAVGR